MTEYFLTQDPSIVARGLAATIVDINRFLHYEFLDDDEATSLIHRSRHNIEELKKFLKNGPESDFKLM